MSNITFLHQTTTRTPCTNVRVNCQISLFYIKPQPSVANPTWMPNCQISLFYIKPQQQWTEGNFSLIVKYHFSTSNHNVIVKEFFRGTIVKYHFSTSNHNLLYGCAVRPLIVKYHFSTSNHNRINIPPYTSLLSNITFLHQTTTNRFC